MNSTHKHDKSVLVYQRQRIDKIFEIFLDDDVKIMKVKAVLGSYLEKC